MSGGLISAAEGADRHPARIIFAGWALTLGGLSLWASLSGPLILLAKLAPAQRDEVYGQLAQSAVAMLAVALTVLAILVALPDRPVVKDLRSSPTWRHLQSTLLSAAALCLLTLVSAHLGTAIDTHARGKEWLALTAICSGVWAAIAILLSGIAFALFLKAADQPDDPSRGRGVPG